MSISISSHLCRVGKFAVSARLRRLFLGSKFLCLQVDGCKHQIKKSSIAFNSRLGAPKRLLKSVLAYTVLAVVCHQENGQTNIFSPKSFARRMFKCHLSAVY